MKIKVTDKDQEEKLDSLIQLLEEEIHCKTRTGKKIAIPKFIMN